MANVIEPTPYVIQNHLNANETVHVGYILVGYHSHNCKDAQVWLKSKSNKILFIDLHNPENTAYMFKQLTGCSRLLPKVDLDQTEGNSKYYDVQYDAAKHNAVTTCAWKNDYSSFS